jgi:hypothetical protein
MREMPIKCYGNKSNVNNDALENANARTVYWIAFAVLC